MNKLFLLHSHLFLVSVVLASCVNSKPVSQALQPGPSATISISVRESRPPKLGYTNAMVQAGMSQGAAGAVLVGIMKGGEMKKTWDFSKRWIDSGGDARTLILAEYRQAFIKAGYVVNDSSANKVVMGPTTPGITSTSQPGLFKALAGPWVNAQLPDGGHGYSTFDARGFSETAFPLDGLTFDVYEKALREAARQSAELVIYGRQKAHAVKAVR